MGGEQKVAAAPEPAELTLRRLVHFTEVLRRNAFTIGLKESEDAARVLASEAAGRPATLRAALKSLLCARRSDWDRFDAIFDGYWFDRARRRSLKISPHPRAQAMAAARALAAGEGAPAPAPGIGELLAGNDPGDLETPQDGVGRMEGASRAEHLAETDFRKIADPQAIPRPRRWRRASPAGCAGGSPGVSAPAPRALASICDAPSAATSATAACRST